MISRVGQVKDDSQFNGWVGTSPGDIDDESRLLLPANC